MKLVLLVASLTLSLHFGYCKKFYANRRIQTDGVFTRQVTADSKECYDLCEKDTQCSAISFHERTSNCMLSYCPFVNLAYNCEYESIVRDDPVVSGFTLPEATHDFVLTENCGRASYGQNRTSISTIGLNFDTNINKPRFGGAMTLPGDLNNGIWSFGKTNPQDSLRAYSSTDGSYTVAFKVYFDKTPATYACLLELRTLKDYSIHYWVWPDNKQLHYNIIDARWEAIPFQFTPKVWHHFAAAYDAPSGVHKIFIDGKLILESSIPYVARRPIELVTVGGRLATRDGLFSGSMYCVSIYNKYLNFQEIQEHDRACSEGQVRVLPKACDCNNECDCS